MKTKECKACGKAVVWLKTVNGKAMPVDAETVKPGHKVFNHKVHTSHFATCPKAKEFRKKREASAAPEVSESQELRTLAVARALADVPLKLILADHKVCPGGALDAIEVMLLHLAEMRRVGTARLIVELNLLRKSLIAEGDRLLI